MALLFRHATMAVVHVHNNRIMGQGPDPAPASLTYLLSYWMSKCSSGGQL